MTDAVEGAHTDFARAMSYGDYLKLDQLLDCQQPISSAHDEMLFVVIHQASELWMKLVIHELDAAIAAIDADQLGAGVKMTARVARIQAQLTQSWDVLATMTPAEYTTFRDELGHSSGFQSYQYRAIEFLLGNKQPAMLKPHAHRPDLHAALARRLVAPSLYDAAQRLLHRRGFAIGAAHLARDLAQPYESDPDVRAAWASVYRDTRRHWDLYELAEELVDLEDAFQVWRFRHMKTVHRIIGFKRGTGGTAGVAYLRQAVDRPFFPELWDVRTDL
jgi:tryptophan 2,3-dioxygenase